LRERVRIRWSAPPKKTGGAAFFDLDKTLMEGSSAFAFGRAAHKAGVYGTRDLLGDAWANVKYRLQGATDETSLALRERISNMLEGVRERDLARLGPDVLVRLLPRVYPEMLAIAYGHQDAGRRVYIVTAASDELAKVLAHVLSFDGGIGSEFSAVVDGVYTGEVAGEFMYRAGKARAIRALAERDGIDLAESYAYSDSESDMPMLRAVGNPVAVNPDAKLLAVAKDEGWEVLILDRLDRRLKAAAALAGVAAAGGIGTAAVAAVGKRRA
jgi:HAD superfamily hydrolase (TIGR01490 family)